MSSLEDDFDGLYNTFHKQVLSWCHIFYSEDHQLAKDIANEVWLQAWNGLSKIDYTNEAKTAAWLKVVTRRMCTRYRRDALHLRRKVPSQETLVDSFDPGVWTSDFDPTSASTTDQCDKEILWSLVNSLSDRQKECIILFYWNDLSMRDIADKLGIAYVTVQVAVYKGRQLLKKKYLQLEEQL